MKINLQVKPTKDVTHIQVEVYYSKGGPNYFSGGDEPRGVWVLARPVRIEEGVIRFLMTAGRRMLLRELKRASEKQLNEVKAEVADGLNARSGPVWDMIEGVMSREGVGFEVRV